MDEILENFYGIEPAEITLLPIGADQAAWVYKAKTHDNKTYFIKRRTGHIQENTVLNLLSSAGIKQIILPIKTVAGHSFYQAADFAMIVYPFIEGQDGFSRPLTDYQWIKFGQLLRQVHEIEVPAHEKIRKETFSSKWRTALKSQYKKIESTSAQDAIASEMKNFLKHNRQMIEKLVDHSEKLSQKLPKQKFVLCHSDIHGGNLLIENEETFYIVDWDQPVLAPKERDLMFIGGGVANVWNKPEEEKLFYQGYGTTEINRPLLAYYRLERIIEDIVIYVEELLLQPACGKDKGEMFKQFMAMFVPNGVVDIAFETN